MSPTEINTLIGLAGAILADESDELVLAKIEQYGGAFEKWYLANRELLLKSPESFGADLLTLSGHHDSVLERAKQLLSRTSGELRKLKLKGKGIIAYTDVLPKKFGLMRPKKG